MKSIRTFLILSALTLATAAVMIGCGKFAGDSPTRDLRIFHAAGFTPVIDELRDSLARDLNIRLLAEPSGSQAACRKVEELGRACDLLILADPRLVAELLSRSCSWRLDFATDEIVLGVGSRAPRVDEAERDWVPVLLSEGIRFGRVDENQGPIGYRAMLVLQLEEQRRPYPGLMRKVIANSTRVMDDVSRLAPLLRHGDLDYAFLYRSICRAMDIRFIELAPEINLGSTEIDYSAASVTFAAAGTDNSRTITITGAPAAWTLTIPGRAADTATAMLFIRNLLKENIELLKWNGFNLMPQPVFYGTSRAFEKFSDLAIYGGSLK